MTVESVREDVRGFLERLKEIDKSNQDYLVSNINKLLSHSLDVNELIGKFTKYMDDRDKLHSEINEYIISVSNELPPIPTDEHMLEILYIMFELKKMNDQAIKDSVDTKLKILPILVYLNSDGIKE